MGDPSHSTSVSPSRTFLSFPSSSSLASSSASSSSSSSSASSSSSSSPHSPHVTTTPTSLPHNPQIDIAYYPHLLDQIISHSPPASLLALSATSHTLHARLKPLLYAHVTLRAAPRNRGQVHSPSYPFTPLRVLQGWRDEEPLHLAHTRVLDLCAAYFYGRANAFPGLKVIRHALEYKTWPMPRFPEGGERRVRQGRRRAPAVISFSPHDDGGDDGEEKLEVEEEDDGEEDDPNSPWLPPEQWQPITDGIYVAYIHLTDPRWHEEHNVPGLYIDPPEGTRRLVLHLSWDPSYPRVRYADIAFGEVALHADIVLVFEPQRESDAPDEEGVGRGEVDVEEDMMSDRRGKRRASSSASRSTSASQSKSKSTAPAKRARHSRSRPPSAPTASSSHVGRGHTRQASTSQPDRDTYHDPLRAHGLFGNLGYALMNRVIEQGVSLTLVGVERCRPDELFLPLVPTDLLPSSPTPTDLLASASASAISASSEDPHGTLAAAHTMLRTIFDSVLVLPEEFGWDCITAWRSMSEVDGGWFDGEVRTGLARHYRFESLDTWCAGYGEKKDERREVRALESRRIEWEEFEDRVRGSTAQRTFTRRP